MRAIMIKLWEGGTAEQGAKSFSFTPVSDIECNPYLKHQENTSKLVLCDLPLFTQGFMIFWFNIYFKIQ